jgi:hypothetical protein
MQVTYRFRRCVITISGEQHSFDYQIRQEAHHLAVGIGFLTYDEARAAAEKLVRHGFDTEFRVNVLCQIHNNFFQYLKDRDPVPPSFPETTLHFKRSKKKRKEQQTQQRNTGGKHVGN